MMNTAPTANDTFIHFGTISRIERNSLTVSLDENVHCGSCRAKGTCGIADSKEVVVSDSKGSFALNEPVAVVLKKETGLKAVFWAYLFPFVLVISTLWIASGFLHEWVAGLLSLLILGPYYLILYLLKDVFTQAFKISILKV
ncbi:SoxR reducing system RseC family protein [Ulvibacterium sp.]|uniref:SoxR reducing system RseC family protein n=1 Tax=Ulvibacterium sp. TaxID=2665914 RepID=UPI003BA8D042